MTGDSLYILREATPAELEQTRQEHFSSWAGGLNGEPRPNSLDISGVLVQLAELV